MSVAIPSFPVSRSADEQNMIDELNLLNDKLLILGLMPYDKDKSHQECVVYCPVEGHGISTKRICNTRQNTGCIYCGTRLGKNISDEEFVRERLPDNFDSKNIIKISTERDRRRSSDRTNMFVTLITKHYTIKTRQKSLKIFINRYDNKISTLQRLHGDYVKVNLNYDGKITNFHAECTIGNYKSNNFSTVKGWTPRVHEKNREEIKNRHEKDTDPWSLIVKNIRMKVNPHNV
ncbi:hypothetical protein [Vibrio coralliirubri]|uniref:hypothetical protein n=1 Tax=Vibrio coralliirubri TaxID=1516159 RepID=UPI000769A522|nr:hypothetical protein [Vibrio coralliirubri]